MGGLNRIFKHKILGLIDALSISLVFRRGNSRNYAGLLLWLDTCFNGGTIASIFKIFRSTFLAWLRYVNNRLLTLFLYHFNGTFTLVWNFIFSTRLRSRGWIRFTTRRVLLNTVIQTLNFLIQVSYQIFKLVCLGIDILIHLLIFGA